MFPCIGAFATRQTIRETWARGAVDVCVAFCLGRPTDGGPRWLRESERHGDVVQVDLVDHYNNLTLKTMLALKYFVNGSHFGPQEPPRYLFKVDEDAFVNLARLSAAMEEVLPRPSKENDGKGSLRWRGRRGSSASGSPPRTFTTDPTFRPSSAAPDTSSTGGN